MFAIKKCFCNKKRPKIFSIFFLGSFDREFGGKSFDILYFSIFYIWFLVYNIVFQYKIYWNTIYFIFIINILYIIKYHCRIMDNTFIYTVYYMIAELQITICNSTLKSVILQISKINWGVILIWSIYISPLLKSFLLQEFLWKD